MGTYMHTDSRAPITTTNLKMIRDPKTGQFNKRSHEVKNLVSRRTDQGIDDAWIFYTPEWLRRRLIVGDAIAFALGYLVAKLLESAIK